MFNFGTNGNQPKANVLWSMYFTVPDTAGENLQQGCLNNSFVCPGPDMDLDYDTAIQHVNFW